MRWAGRFLREPLRLRRHQQPPDVQWMFVDVAAGMDAAATDPSNAVANRVTSTCFTVSSSMSGGRVPPLTGKVRRVSVATLR